jgi:hypothetical protein
MWGALSDERTGLSFTIPAGPRQRSRFRVKSTVELTTIFYCLRFDSSDDSQGYGGGIRHRLHTGGVPCSPNLGPNIEQHPVGQLFPLLFSVATKRVSISGQRADLFVVE